MNLWVFYYVIKLVYNSGWGIQLVFNANSRAVKRNFIFPFLDYFHTPFLQNVSGHKLQKPCQKIYGESCLSVFATFLCLFIC